MNKMIIRKPWGSERIIERTNDYVVKELRVNPNSRLSLQYHIAKIETVFLVDGEGYLDIVCERHGQKCLSSQKMCRLYPYHIPSETVHRLYTKNKSCTVTEISSTELNDVVRLEDDYDRISSAKKDS